MNKIWTTLIFASLIFSIITNTQNNLTKALLTSTEKAFTLFLKTSFLLLFWSGIFQIALDAGIIPFFARIFKKPLLKLFPELKETDKAYEYIVSNFVANLFGIGAAATPLGLLAFQELQKENKNKTVPSRTMITFLCINASSLTIIPTTILSWREIEGGKTSIFIIILMILSTFYSTVLAVILDRFFYKQETLV